MSWSNYEKALILLEQNKEECDFVGERSELLIDKAEKEFGIKFSKIYRHFLKTFGAGNFGSQEIYGVLQEDFENSSVPDAIWYTLTERKTGLSEKLLIIYHTGMDDVNCLDFNNLNDENEPAVVSVYLGVDWNEQPFEVIADDFGDFLLEIIQEEL